MSLWILFMSQHLNPPSALSDHSESAAWHGLSVTAHMVLHIGLGFIGWALHTVPTQCAHSALWPWFVCTRMGGTCVTCIDCAAMTLRGVAHRKVCHDTCRDIGKLHLFDPCLWYHHFCLCCFALELAFHVLC